MGVCLTARAAEHVATFAKQQGDVHARIRLSVRPSGCSGFSYDLELVDTENQDDFVFESYGVSVIVDPKSFVHVDGVTLDYVREGVQEGFQFNNPNAKAICGCGESFHV